MGWFRVTFIETKSFGNIHAKNIVSHGLDKTKKLEKKDNMLYAKKIHPANINPIDSSPLFLILA